MHVDEAVEIIKSIADSLDKNPGQFQFEVNVTGTMAASYGGGTGLHVQTTGGGPGSHTVGYQSSVSGNDIRIAQKSADEAITGQIRTTVAQLNEIIAELKLKSPEHGRIRNIFAVLTQTWLPGVVTSIVGNVLTLAGIQVLR